MRVDGVSCKNELAFEHNFKLNNVSIKFIEENTKLSYDEIRLSSLDEATKLMKKRGSFNEINKAKQWLADKYRQIGEKLGFLEKNYNTYTDID